MGEFEHEKMVLAAATPALRPSVGPSGIPLRGSDLRTWLAVIPLALVLIYAFMPALGNGFVNWDDDNNFLQNPYFRGLGIAQVQWALTTVWLGVYQPFAWLLFEVQYVFCQLNPHGYHLISLVLQVFNAVVLYYLTVAFLVRCHTDFSMESAWVRSMSAALATALFMVHPLRVEVVAWASCQPYLPCIFFSMLATLAYLRAFPADSSPRWGWLAGSFLLFVAALLFKAVAVSLPVVFLILDVYPLRRFPDETGRWFGPPARRALLEKIPFVMTSLLFTGLAIAARSRSSSVAGQFHVLEGIARTCYVTWFYILKTVLPLGLTAVYPLPVEHNRLMLCFRLSILATFALTTGLYLFRRRWPGLLAAWLSYLVILAPNAGFVRVDNQQAADRYTYMAMLGSAMLAAAGFYQLWRMTRRWHLVIPGGIVALSLAALLGLTALTRTQCGTWLNSEKLWTHALADGAASSFEVQNNMGTIRSSQRRYREAEAHFAEAIRLQPGYVNARNNLGNALSSQGKYEAARAQLEESLRLNPGNADAHNGLGAVLSRERRYAEAVAHFIAAIQLQPGQAIAHENLGGVLSQLGSYEEAKAQYAEAIRLDPGDADAHCGLGTVLLRQGKYEKAEVRFAEALRLNPRHENAHHDLDLMLPGRGKFESAAHYDQALRLNPGLAEAHFHWGADLQRRGNNQAAEAHFAEALRQKPDYAAAHYNLGNLLAGVGRYGEAVPHFREAVRLDPGFADGHFNLGIILFGLGDFGDARAQFAEAIRLRPGDPDAYNASAMLMAACPVGKFRNGKEAVQLATRACELTNWKNPNCVNTLAAAQAEAGDFAGAVKSQERAIKLLTDERQKDDHRSRLVLYQAKKPYRQASPRRID